MSDSISTQSKKCNVSHSDSGKFPFTHGITALLQIQHVSYTKHSTYLPIIANFIKICKSDCRHLICEVFSLWPNITIPKKEKRGKKHNGEIGKTKEPVSIFSWKRHRCTSKRVYTHDSETICTKMHNTK